MRIRALVGLFDEALREHLADRPVQHTRAERELPVGPPRDLAFQRVAMAFPVTQAQEDVEHCRGEWLEVFAVWAPAARQRLPLTVCTIYDGCFADAAFQRIASTTLALFNDAIIRVAAEHALSVIDLRFVCARAEDYATRSTLVHGGEKIARAIVGLVTGSKASTSATPIVIA